MKKILILALVSGFLSLPIFKNAYANLASFKTNLISKLYQSPDSRPSDAPAKIQVALLLDTSNSMDGLIDQAKSQLWKMVNELATAKKGATAPNIEIALLYYGNSGLSAAKGYVKEVVPLTTDLDLVSEKLFQLRTAGGEEYCGWAIKDATANLAWSDNNNDLKLIIIAGNEPFNQGPTDYKSTCKTAISKGIMINTIHCGDYQKGVNEFWKDGADLTDGSYMNINQDDQVVHIPTPFDDEIIRLNQSLNSTYIGYGSAGILKAQNQVAQDANAASYGKGNARTRASFKAKESYSNASWDLVDASKDNEAFLEEAEAEELPEEMQKMDTKERKEYVESKRKERASIQKEILVLEQKAKTFEAKEREKNADQQTLDNVLIEAVKKQAVSKSFAF